MCPSGFFAPQVSKLVSNGIICCLCQAGVLAFAKLVVSLGDLPDVRVDGYSFTPAQSHETDAIGNLGSYALQFEQLLMSMTISFSSTSNVKQV